MIAATRDRDVSRDCQVSSQSCSPERFFFFARTILQPQCTRDDFPFPQRNQFPTKVENYRSADRERRIISTLRAKARSRRSGRSERQPRQGREEKEKNRGLLPRAHMHTNGAHICEQRRRGTSDSLPGRHDT